MVFALHKWLVLIFSTITEASNQQIHANVVPEGLYILVGNDVISCFWSAVDRVHAVAAADDFTVTKLYFRKISETT